MVKINGEPAPAAGRRVEEIIRDLGFNAGRVAVLLNGELLKAGEWQRELNEGDDLEVVTLMQGGSDQLIVAGEALTSRLFMGTGKFRDFGLMQEAFAVAQPALVTVSVRRVQTGVQGHAGLLEAIAGFKILPNTAGARNAAEAIKLAELGRELVGHNWVKLEVIPDPRYLFPDPIETYQAACELIGRGFVVLPYTGPDAVLAARLSAAGTATVMPLGSPIGSGWGLASRDFLPTLLEAVTVPLVVDAGLRVPSEAALALEMGASAVLVNTAIAEAQDPVLMAQAFAQAVQAGRNAYLAGPMPRRERAVPSSPAYGVPGS